MVNRSYSKEIHGNRFYFERVDKKTARRAYNNNLTVIFCPVNLSPFSPEPKPGNIKSYDYKYLEV